MKVTSVLLHVLCAIVALLSTTTQSIATTGTGYHFLWNVGGTNDVNLTAFPGITTGCVALMTTWFGAYPLIRPDPHNSSKLEWCNGGIPQLANITFHKNYIKRDLDMKVDPDFDGFIVVDYEAWRAVWNHTEDTYQKASIELASHQNPNATQPEIERIAVQQYNKAALNFMVTTLETVQTLRPKSRVGFYGYPYRSYWDGYYTKDGDKLRKLNDQINDLWVASSALFPSIYQFYPQKSFERNRQYVNATLGEAKRIAGLQSRPKPIYAYGWFMYHDRSGFLLDKDTYLEFTQPAIENINGTIIWGDQHGNSTKEQQLQQYLDNHVNTFNNFTNGPPLNLQCAKKNLLSMDAVMSIDDRSYESAHDSEFPPPWKHCSL